MPRMHSVPGANNCSQTMQKPTYNREWKQQIYFKQLFKGPPGAKFPVELDHYRL